MNKRELVKTLATELNVTDKLANEFVNTFISTLSNELADGGELKLIGFGSFVVKNRKSRVGTNPKTGEKLTIPAKKVAYFKPGKDLNEVINS